MHFTINRGNIWYIEIYKPCIERSYTFIANLKKISFILFLILGYNCILNIKLCSAQWIKTSDGMPSDQIIYSFTSNDSYLFAGTLGGVYISNDNGAKWTYSGLQNEIFALYTLGTNIFAGGSNGVFKSTNNGLNWVSASLGQQIDITAFTSVGTILFAGTFGAGVYLTTNYGADWVPRGLANKPVYSLYTKGTDIFAGIGYFDGGIYFSSDNGINWIARGLTGDGIHSICSINNNLFVGDDGIGVQLTSNNGENWSATALTNQTVFSLVSGESDIFAGTSEHGVFVSTNNGGNWLIKNQGFNEISRVNALFIKDNYIFAGTFQNAVWRRSLSDITGVSQNDEIIPVEITLQQNYPNPFNPNTIINYTVPENQNITLRVYDVLGHSIATLVNKKQSAGNYNIEWNAEKFPSGIYFYKLETKGFTITRRMLLIK